MKVCKDCKNISKCEYVWPSKPCEKWEPGLNDKFYLFGYIDGFNDGVKGYEQKLSEAHARLSEVEDWMIEHGIRKARKEMSFYTYTVKAGGLSIAQHMTFENAMIFVKALFAERCGDGKTMYARVITIEREEQEEEKC